MHRRSRIRVREWCWRGGSLLLATICAIAQSRAQGEPDAQARRTVEAIMAQAQRAGMLQPALMALRMQYGRTAWLGRAIDDGADQAAGPCATVSADQATRCAREIARARQVAGGTARAQRLLVDWLQTADRRGQLRALALYGEMEPSFRESPQDVQLFASFAAAAASQTPADFSRHWARTLRLLQALGGFDPFLPALRSVRTSRELNEVTLLDDGTTGHMETDEPEREAADSSDADDALYFCLEIGRTDRPFARDQSFGRWFAARRMRILFDSLLAPNANGGFLAQMLNGPGAIVPRFMYEAMILTSLRVIPADSAVRGLQDESAALMATILRRCQADPACLRGFYPFVRASKGLLSAALGSKLPLSAGMLLQLTPAEEQHADSVARRFATAVMARRPFPCDEPQRRFWVGISQRSFAPSRDGDTEVRTRDEPLRPGEWFVDFYRTDRLTSGAAPRYVAFLRSAGGETRYVDIGSHGAVESVANTLLTAAQTRDQGNHEWDAARERFIRDIWNPIARGLPSDARRVILAPDGLLGTMPWPALIPPTTRAYDLRVVASWRDFVVRRDVPSPAREFQRVTIVSNLVYGDGGPFAPIVNEAVWPALGAGQGAQLVGLSGTNARRTEVLTALRRSDYAVLSTHGMSPDGADSVNTRRWLRASRLALSGANQDASSVITAGDLAELDLRHLRVLILAACDVGTGVVKDGQGLLGFPSAVSASGVQSALLALWSVPDNAATKLLLETFTERTLRQGWSATRALEDAQAVVRRRFPAPNDWAGWTVIGDLDSMERP